MMSELQLLTKLAESVLVMRHCVAYMDSTWRFLELIGSSSFTIPVASYVFRSSLKLKSSDAETVMSMHLAAGKFLSLIPSILSNENLQILEVDWKKETIDVPIASKLRILAGLGKVWELKPLVNGKDIMSILQLKSGGPIVKEWQQKLLEWQLAHPSGSADECIEWMSQTQSKRARTE
ncbi:UNVERIFIED_CONTAM: hypothetical protein Sradi_3693700 [Sesamum radiatum]|uniref:Uncharacterized protein n=1 Tax=Sesamum radiatum TaxID=300843 RepID=A0AAW2PX89_SESRA